MYDIVLPRTCLNRFVNQSFLAGSKALVEILRSTVLKRDLKQSATFFRTNAPECFKSRFDTVERKISTSGFDPAKND